jgi:hypothetical protein
MKVLQRQDMIVSCLLFLLHLSVPLSAIAWGTLAFLGVQLL